MSHRPATRRVWELGQFFWGRSWSSGEECRCDLGAKHDGPGMVGEGEDEMAEADSVARNRPERADGVSDGEGTRTLVTPSTREEAIALVVQACQALATAGQDDLVWGHPSVRDPQGRGVWMKAAGWGFAEVDADRVVLVTPDGNVLDGTARRHIEYPIHTEIVNRRRDVGAVVHTHSDAANAFAALDTPLQALNHAGSLFVYPDLPRFTVTGGLIKTPELGQALADALGDAPACLMPQHGLVAVGKDIPTAVMTSVLVDKACRVQLSAMASGTIKRYGSEDDTVAKRAEVWADSQILAGWHYLLRRWRPQDRIEL